MLRTVLSLPAVLMMLTGLFSTNAQSEVPKVVVSIPPLHSIVARVMQGVGDPDLLVPAGASPHAFSLKPSQARLIQNADLVVYVGPTLERFLEQILDAGSHGARIVEAMDLPGLTLVKRREGGVWKSEGVDHGHEHEHEHEHETAGHDHDADIDPHIWLDPVNASVIARKMAERLSEIDAGHSEIYFRNAEIFSSEIEVMTGALSAELLAVASRKYIVFHDAYRYFEERFALSPVGAVTLNPETTPGAAQVIEIADLIKDRGADCLFSEPQFEPRLVQRLAESGSVKLGILDPLGSGLKPGPALYPEMMRRLSDSLLSCLRQE